MLSLTIVPQLEYPTRHWIATSEGRDSKMLSLNSFFLLTTSFAFSSLLGPTYLLRHLWKRWCHHQSILWHHPSHHQKHCLWWYLRVSSMLCCSFFFLHNRISPLRPNPVLQQHKKIYAMITYKKRYISFELIYLWFVVSFCAAYLEKNIALQFQILLFKIKV